jgi:hypothetical protein
MQAFAADEQPAATMSPCKSSCAFLGLEGPKKSRYVGPGNRVICSFSFFSRVRLLHCQSTPKVSGRVAAAWIPLPYARAQPPFAATDGLVAVVRNHGTTALPETPSVELVGQLKRTAKL